MSRIIAISGWRSSGKDTASDFLVEQYGYTKLSLAGALKDLVAEQYGIPRSWCDDRNYKEAGITKFPVNNSDKFSEQIHRILESELKCGYWTPRALCILEGSIKRSVNADYWTSRIVSQMHPDGKYVISDLRFQSEANTLRKLIPTNELLLLRINRFESIDTNEASERDLDSYQFDSYIQKNVQTIPQLHAALRMLAMSAGLERNAI